MKKRNRNERETKDENKNAVGKQTGVYYGDGRGGYWSWKPVEIPVFNGKKRRFSVFNSLPVFYCDSGASGDDHGDVSGKENPP